MACPVALPAPVACHHAPDQCTAMQSMFHVKPPGGYGEGGRSGKEGKRGGPTPPKSKFLQKLSVPHSQNFFKKFSLRPLPPFPLSLTPTVPRCLPFFPRYRYTVASINTHEDCGTPITVPTCKTVFSRVGWFMWLPPLWSVCATAGNSSPTTY